MTLHFLFAAIFVLFIFIFTVLNKYAVYARLLRSLN